MQDQVYEARVMTRVAANLAEYLVRLERSFTESLAEQQALREEILADVRALAESHEDEELDALLGELRAGVQAVCDGTTGGGSMASLSIQAGDYTIGVERGCVGLDGGGITATKGNTTVKGCVTGSIGTGPTGGGVEVKTQC